MKPERPHDPSNPPMGVSPADPGPDTEREWIARAAAGDRVAFASLVDRHRDRAYRLALRVLRSPNDAEEVAQDAFVRVWRALPRFRGEASFATWLHRIVLRCTFDRAAILRGRRQRETPYEDASDRVDRLAAPAAGPRDPRALERLMRPLSDVQRAAVTLFYAEDRPVEEIARVLGLPANTVKTHLSRARAAMRAALEEGGT